MEAVVITDEPLSIDELLRIVRGATVRLASGARTRIERSRAVVDRMVAGEAAVYGLNTGVGHMKDTRLSDDELRTGQEMLIVTHAGGVGPPLATELVRAAMAVRLNGIARGGSGASLRMADVLAQMLNARVHPIVAGRGSVGAADLGQLAEIGLVAIGRGRAEHGGDLVAGGEALRRAGIEPLGLEPKDGLTIMSANAVSIGHGALVLARAADVADRADVTAAVSLEATEGNPSIALPEVGAAKPFPGQIASCRAVSDALAGSSLSEPGGPRSVQDPLSFRVVPQVHGAFREAVSFAGRAVDVELNGRGDNPLVSLDDGTMIHNGNFHPMVMAIAFDQLRISIAHVGQLSERRMSHLWDAFFERLADVGPPAVAEVGPTEAFGLSLRYPAAAVYSELRQLAAPATLDAPPLDIGVEDHATSAPLAVRKTDEALDLLEDLLSIEVLLARDVFGIASPRSSLGVGTGAILGRAARAIAELKDDRSPAHVQRAVRDALSEQQAVVPSDLEDDAGGRHTE
jgi:histidine ammonia-lyase